VEKNIRVNGQFMNTLSSASKLCLCHEPTVEITKHCNRVSYLSDRGISYNNKMHFLVINLHQSMLCRPKNIQNIILNQNLGIRSIHNVSTTDLFGSVDKVLKIEKLSQKETDSQEEYTLKLETKTAKGSHRPRKRQGSSEGIKDVDNKTTDGFLQGEKYEDVTSKGNCHVYQVSLQKGSQFLIIMCYHSKLKHN
jgi:hypothetical protein